MPALLYRILRLTLLNPICLRLVTTASRRPRQLYLRSAYLGLLGGVLLVGMLGVTAAGRISLRELAAGSASVFTLVSLLQLVLICIVTPVFVAGAIAREARPITWDILLTTPLSALQVVLGNLLGRLFFIAALLLAAIPVMAVTQFFGGVPGRVILLSQLVALCLALVITAAAIAMSVTRTAGQRAVLGFFGVVVAYLAVTFAFDRMMREPVGLTNAFWTTPMTALNPFLVLEVLLRPGTHVVRSDGAAVWPLGWCMAHPVTAWCSMTSAVSLVLVAFSALRVRALSDVSARRISPTKDASDRATASVRGNPIAWRERVTRFRSTGSLWARWGYAGVGTLVAVVMVSCYASGLWGAETLRSVVAWVVGAELAVVTLAAISLSASSIAREREDGSLDLLLITSVTPSTYLSGKIHGLVMHLLPLVALPCLTLMAMGAAAAATGERAIVPEALPWPPYDVGTPMVLWPAAVASPLVVVPYIAFCVAIGLLWSLRSRGSIGSIVAAVLVLLVVTVGLGLCIVPAGSGMGHLGSYIAALSPANYVMATLFPATVVDSTMRSGGGLMAGTSLAIAAFVAAGTWSLICWGLVRSMAASFVMTVRRLAGTV